MAQSPIGFIEPRTARPPASAETTPGPPAATSTTTRQATLSHDQPPAPATATVAQEVTDEGQSRLRARVARLRAMASGNRRPLASPEGDRHLNRGETKRSWASSERSGVVDLIAISVRQVTEWADWAMARRTRGEKDLVATADEAYKIAAPAATWALDHIPEGSAIEGLVEHAGIAGAGVGVVGWGTRVIAGRPGGRAESEALRDRVARRLADGARATLRRQVEAAESAVAEAGAEVAPVAERTSYGAMLGLDEDNLMDVGPV